MINNKSKIIILTFYEIFKIKKCKYILFNFDKNKFIEYYYIKYVEYYKKYNELDNINEKYKKSSYAHFLKNKKDVKKLCEICNIEVCIDSLFNHNKSKKHLKNLNFKNELSEIANKL